MSEKKTKQFRTPTTAAEMMDDLYELLRMRNEGRINEEVFRDLYNCLKSATKVHGDNIREQAVTAMMLINKQDTRQLTRVFTRVSLPAAEDVGALRDDAE